jgi:hypothetical protein
MGVLGEVRGEVYLKWLFLLHHLLVGNKVPLAGRSQTSVRFFDARDFVHLLGDFLQVFFHCFDLCRVRRSTLGKKKKPRITNREERSGKIEQKKRKEKRAKKKGEIDKEEEERERMLCGKEESVRRSSTRQCRLHPKPLYFPPLPTFLW